MNKLFRSILGFLLIFSSSLVFSKTEVKDIIEQYKGSVLAPEDVSKIDYSKLEKGYKYTLRYIYNDNTDEPVFSTYLLSKVEGGKVLFSILNEKENLGVLAMFDKGIAFERRDETSEFYMSPGSLDVCTFKLGLCTYTSFSGKKVIVNTSFKDGVWIQEVSSRFNRTLNTVYDKNGFILYKITKGSAQTEIVRIK